MSEIAAHRDVETGTARCTECHRFYSQDEDATAPDLTGYGSRSWLIDFIGNPAHERFYGSRNDRMPAFGKEQRLDPQALGLLADWLRGDWHEPVPEPGIVSQPQNASRPALK